MFINMNLIVFIKKKNKMIRFVIWYIFFLKNLFICGFFEICNSLIGFCELGNCKFWY